MEHKRQHEKLDFTKEMYHTNSSQVLRYSALIFGVLYGFQHQRTLNSNARAAHAHAEYQHKADLIQKAKLEWAKKSLPPEAKTASGDSASSLTASSRWTN